MTLTALNELSDRETAELFLTCCGSNRWAHEMTKRRPFQGLDQLKLAADEIWHSLSEADWKEAFARHPKIGDIESLAEKFQSTAALASKEQSGVIGASVTTLNALAEGNAAYESKFGYIFIVCATGKSAEEMLAMLNERLNNDPDAEIHIAAQEQAKITRLRLEKLFLTK